MTTDAAGPTRVLVVGDANPDLVLRGDIVPRFGQAEQLLDDAVLVIGGSAAITAHAFARLQRPVSLVAAVGKDAFGERICRELAEAGVSVQLVLERADAPTGLTVVLARARDRAILTLPGAIASLTGGEVQTAVAELGASGSGHVHVSSLFLNPDLARELPDILAAARAAGLTTSLDTNDDPAGQWQLDGLLEHLDVLLPNRAEALALAAAIGGSPDDDITAAAVRLAAHGPLVIVKDGAAGVVAADRSGPVASLAVRPRASVDTTGAGDTFDAAFLDSWLDGRPLHTGLRRAAEAGARAVSAVGGTAGQPTAADLATADSDPEHDTAEKDA